jgi:flavin reductase (DIM6/NTAB) family NADH-FMN oxidoreductase RutF
MHEMRYVEASLAPARSCRCQTIRPTRMSEISRHPVRRTLRAMTHGVYVLSAHHHGHDAYIVISLAMQCSVQPPRITFAVTPGARVVAALRGANGGVLSVLDASQTAAVRRYGAPGGVKHPPERPERDASGHPVPGEASHWMSFTVAQEMSVGDHLLFVADVTHAAVRNPERGANNALAGDVVGGGEAQKPLAPMILGNTGFPYAG